MKHLSLILVCTALFTLGGCVDDLKTIKTHSAKAAAWVETADAKIDGLEAQINALPEGDKLHRIKASLERLKDEREQVAATLKTLNEGVQEADQPEDLLGVGVQAALPFLGPYGGIASLVASLIGGILAHQRMKKKGLAAIRNIDHVINSPEFGGAGKFDANDPATLAAMKQMDHKSGARSLVVEALS